MKYSFLLPAYKTEFLAESIQSILNQSYSDFTLVVSDDCSPNPVGEIVDSFKDPRIQYRRNEKNLGASNLVDHWNLLLRQCNSDYVIIASDDDKYNPNFLKEVDRIVLEYPDVDLIRVRANIINGQGLVIKEDPEDIGVASYEDFIRHYLSPNEILCIGNYVFKTDALRRIGGFVKFPMAWKSDSATQISLAYAGVPCTKDILFSFRMSGLNISSNMSEDEDKSRKKLGAIFQFEKWLESELTGRMSNSDSAMILQSFRNRLEGESRSYYKMLGLSEFFSLYSYMLKRGWFKTFRAKVSFVAFWIKSKLGYSSFASDLGRRSG